MEQKGLSRSTREMSSLRRPAANTSLTREARRASWLSREKAAPEINAGADLHDPRSPRARAAAGVADLCAHSPDGRAPAAVPAAPLDHPGFLSRAGCLAGVHSARPRGPPVVAGSRAAARRAPGRLRSAPDAFRTDG